MDVKKLLEDKNKDEVTNFFKSFDWSLQTHNIPNMVYSGSIAKNIHFGYEITRDAPSHISKKGQLRDIDLGVMGDGLDWLFELMQSNFTLDDKNKSFDEKDSFKQLDEDTQKRILEDIKQEKYKYFTMTHFKFMCPITNRKVEIHKTSTDKTVEIFSYIHKENVRVTSLYTFIMGSIEWSRPKDIYFLQKCNEIFGSSIPIPKVRKSSDLSPSYIQDYINQRYSRRRTTTADIHIMDYATLGHPTITSTQTLGTQLPDWFYTENTDPISNI